MRNIAIAGIQMPISASENNLPAIRRRIEHVAHRYPWVQMVVLSELATCGPLALRAETLPGPSEIAYQELAQRLGLWIVTGSIYERVEDKVYNTLSVIAPDGQIIGRYRKLFPFRPYEYDTTPGEHFLVFDVPGIGRFGCVICYDIWFPEVTRSLAAMGVEVILRPTLTDTIDRDIELTISRATAAIQQCFVVDINGLGAGGNGRSLIVDPDGNILHEAGAGEEIIPLELDLDQVTRARARGFKGLGQTLKSFRDRKVQFPLYQPGAFDLSYLDSLGELKKPDRALPLPIAPAERDVG